MSEPFTEQREIKSGLFKCFNQLHLIFCSFIANNLMRKNCFFSNILVTIELIYNRKYIKVDLRPSKVHNEIQNNLKAEHNG